MKPSCRLCLRLFWAFFKINWMSTSGPASIGLLYDEVTEDLLAEKDFVEAVGFANFLPGSEALKLGIFIGYRVGRVPGVISAVAGAILPPVMAVSAMLYVLMRLPAATDWLASFSNGLNPAVAALIGLVGWRFLRPDTTQAWRKKDILLAFCSLAALLAGIPSPLALLLAGLTGILIYR